MKLNITGTVGDLAAGMQNMGLQGGSAEVYFGTVVPVQGFNAEQDAAVLRKAMKGIGERKKYVS